jgi:hypothetical protein
MTEPRNYDAVLGSRNKQPKPYDAVLGGKNKTCELLNIEILSGRNKELKFLLWVKINDFNELRLILRQRGWQHRSVRIGSIFADRVNSPPVFCLDFNFYNIDGYIHQLCQSFVDGPQLVKIKAISRDIDTTFVCYYSDVYSDKQVQKNDTSPNRESSMLLILKQTDGFFVIYDHIKNRVDDIYPVEEPL